MPMSLGEDDVVTCPKSDADGGYSADDVAEPMFAQMIMTMLV